MCLNNIYQWNFKVDLWSAPETGPYTKPIFYDY